MIKVNNKNIIFFNRDYTYSFDKIFNVYVTDKTLYVNDIKITNIKSLKIFIYNDEINIESLQPNKHGLVYIDEYMIKSIIDLIIFDKYNFETCKTLINKLIDDNNNELIKKIDEYDDVDYKQNQRMLDSLTLNYNFINLLDITTIKRIIPIIRDLNIKPDDKYDYYRHSKYNDYDNCLKRCVEIANEPTIKHNKEDYFLKHI